MEELVPGELQNAFRFGAVCPDQGPGYGRESGDHGHKTLDYRGGCKGGHGENDGTDGGEAGPVRAVWSSRAKELFRFCWILVH